VLEDALQVIRRGETPLTVAGRTDAGVHARGQVASHEGAPALARALNGVLPPDVRVLASEAAPEGFDARRDAISRTYRYRLHPRQVASPFQAGRALHWPHEFDREALEACAAALRGTHDFTAFTPSETRHVHFQREVLRAEWADAPGGLLDFWIEADTFMRHMVRILVGSMLAVSRGRFDPAWFAALLEGRPRSDAAETAPAHALYLEGVSYPATTLGDA
jgi:tRNA pseudouridine38-40 synthase